MPVTRLQPQSFPEPERFIAYIEEDPSILEEGLSVVARRVPLPVAGPSVVLDLLALDSGGRVVHVDVRTVLTSQALEAAAAAGDWIRRNLVTLKALCPPLARASGGVRSILVVGRIDEALVPLLAGLTSAGSDLVLASLFDSPSGPAVSFRPAAPATAGAGRREPSRPASAGPEAGPALEIPSDPLAGIPLSPEELSEFRRLVSPPRGRSHGGRRKSLPVAGGGAPPPPFAVVEN